MSVPPVLLGPAFEPVWRQVAETLDARGLDFRGQVTVPRDVDRTVHRDLCGLLERTRQVRLTRLDLAALEASLAVRGTDLLSVLEATGFAPTGKKEARAAEAARRAERDDALRQAAHDRWGDEPWVAGWVAGVRSTVPDRDEACRAVDLVARVLAEAGRGDRRSRAEIAALTVRGAHSLDRRERERSWVRVALAHRAGDPRRDDPELWADAGLPGDEVSAPALTWALPLLGDGVAHAVRLMTVAGAPAPLATMTVRDLAVAVPPGTVVLSVENPRLLEAAAQRRLDAPLVCTSGEPTRGVVHLLEALRDAGAEVRHHGDVDAGGLGIASRLHARGVTPWRTTAADYRAAVARAVGIELPRVDPDAVPPTPWDPDLQREVQRVGLAVEQERVMDEVLAAHAAGAGRS